MKLFCGFIFYLFLRTYSQFQTCLSPLRETCKDDMTWAMIELMEASYGTKCGGGGNGTGTGAGNDQACDYFINGQSLDLY